MNLNLSLKLLRIMSIGYLSFALILVILQIWVYGIYDPSDNIAYIIFGFFSFIIGTLIGIKIDLIKIKYAKYNIEK